MLGRLYDSGRDAVAMWNADWNSANAIVLPFTRTTTTGANVGVQIVTPNVSQHAGTSRSIRVGYMVVKGY